MHPAKAKIRQIEATEAIAAKQDLILEKLDQLLAAQPAPAKPDAPAKGAKKE